MKLLTQNADLKKTGIYGWTLPAHWVKLSNGKSLTRAQMQEFVQHFVMLSQVHLCLKMLELPILKN